MDELKVILDQHISKHKIKEKPTSGGENEKGHAPVLSEIPDLFFDEILIEYKLGRVETMVLMFLYRMIWCHANLYRVHGISPLMAYGKMAENLKLPLEELQNTLVKLEGQALIETIRPGQYFVRRFFTAKNDAKYEQSYDDFNV